MAESNNDIIGALLGIHAHTSLHPGSGTALGTVDLPVQRERHTQWPVVAGSAVKGILRDACRERVKGEYRDDGADVPEKERRSRRRKANEEHPLLVAAFGPGKVDESSAHAGALAVTDARLLAFPVRSLRGVFAWATCPAVLERLRRDLQLARLGHNFTVPKEALKSEQDAVTADPKSPLLVGEAEKCLVLEEFEFRQAGTPGAANTVATWVGEHVADAETAGRVASHLVILHDDQFTHFARHATEVVARIGLNYDTKTVRDGALFYQEFLPPETLLYSVVLANPSRQPGRNGNGGGRYSAGEIFDFLKGNLPPHLQIGGDETTGKGLCAVQLTRKGD